VREFVEKAFQELGIAISWEGTGVDEVGRDADTGNVLVRVDPRYFRPTEVEILLGDPTKAKKNLGWEPRTTFAELAKMMVREDLKEAERDRLCGRAGYKIYNRYE
jgi:GDPmannose 4,6-dehydratase